MLTPRALREWLRAEGHPAYRGEQVLRWVYQGDAAAFEVMTDLSGALREALGRDFHIPRLPPPAVTRSRDGTCKLLFPLGPAGAIETVLIPEPPRNTVCLSSQAGCAMGCRFCATGQLGLRRQLNAGEIVAQVRAARRHLGGAQRLTNVVLMGMGEPLANYDAVVEAIGILTAPWGLELAGRRITVSTVGLLPQLERLVRDTSVRVAVSLTAVSDRVRNWLMPVNERYPLDELMATCRALPMAHRQRITFEYVLLGGVNDTSADAARLVRLLHGVRAKVNLIPFNPFPGADFKPPPPARARRFQERLLAAGVSTTLRTPRGSDIGAACGQLAGHYGDETDS